jgi:hypothetical protein
MFLAAQHHPTCVEKQCRKEKDWGSRRLTYVRPVDLFMPARIVETAIVLADDSCGLEGRRNIPRAASNAK